MTDARSPEESLDRAWDRLVAGTPPRADELDLLAVARDVAARDDIPGASPDAVARMRRRLRAAMTEDHMPTISPNGALHSTLEPIRPIARPTRLRPDGKSHSIVELTTAALLVAALLIAALGWGHLPGQRGPSRPGPQLAAPSLASPLPAATAQPPAGTLGGDPARTGQLPGPGPLGTASIVWSVQERAVSLVVAGSRIYTLQYQGVADNAAVVAMDGRTGAELWTTSVGAEGGRMPAPSIANGLVYVPTSAGVTALDERTGSVVWTYDAPANLNSESAAVADGLVYATFRDRTLRAIDAATGHEVWHAAMPDSAVNPAMMPGALSNMQSPSVANGIVYALGNGGLLVAVDARSGHQLWTFQAAGDNVSTPVISAGLVFLSARPLTGAGSKYEGWIQAVNAKSGELAWQSPEQSAVFVLAAADGIVYLGGVGGTVDGVSAVEAKTGRGHWVVERANAVGGGVLSNGILYYLNGNGVLTQIDVSNGHQIWRTQLGDIGNFVVVDGLAIVAGQQSIYAIGGVQNSTTPVASPVTTDLSGLPPCQPPRTVPAELPTGTPTARLDIETHVIQPVTPGEIPQVLAANLPTGPAASAEDVAGIEQTLTEIANCMPPAGESDAIAGFFTDDYYRRGSGAGGSSTYFHGWPSRNNTALTLAVGNTVVLPDGRVAAQINYNATPKRLLIFVEQNGQWLIDEEYLIVKAYTDGVG